MMQDSRLNEITALLDDSRCLIADMRDEGVLAEDRIALEGIRKHLNEAIRRANALKGAVRGER